MDNKVMEITEQEMELMEIIGEKKLFFTTLKSDTHEQKVEFYNILNGDNSGIVDKVGQVLEITDVHIEKVKLSDDNGGTVTSFRTYLIDKDKKAYTGVSTGVLNSLKRIFGIFGTPDTWKEPMKIVPRIITKGKDKITTLDLVL